MMGPDGMSSGGMMGGMDSSAMANAAAAAVMQSFLSGAAGGGVAGMTGDLAEGYNSDSNSSNGLLGRDDDFDLDSESADSPLGQPLGSALDD